MKRYLIIALFFSLLLVSCATDVVVGSTASPAPTITTEPGPPVPPVPLPWSTPGSLVYGIKTVTYDMSNYEGDQQGLKLYQYMHERTDIYAYGMDQRTTTLLFSDKDLPVFIMNTSGGGETALHDIVAISIATGKLYARMLPRDQYTTYMDAGSLYELSTDGTNTFKKLFDFDHPFSFILSPDGTRIAYIADNSLVIRVVDTGREFGHVDLSAYKDNWISKISWSPDSRTILVDVQSGEASVTPAEPYSTTNGVYLVDIDKLTLKKLTPPVFQSPMELATGFMTDPFSYSYFPISNRLIGFARNYAQKNVSYAVEFYSVGLDGNDLVPIPVGNNEAIWEVNLSPDEQTLAYPCLQNLCVANIRSGRSERITSPILVGTGTDQEQTVIGWLKK